MVVKAPHGLNTGWEVINNDVALASCLDAHTLAALGAWVAMLICLRRRRVQDRERLEVRIDADNEARAKARLTTMWSFCVMIGVHTSPPTRNRRSYR